MMLFQVTPEVAGQVPGQIVQGGVVETRLPLFEIVHQEISDRAAADTEPVDELLHRHLPTGVGQVAQGTGGFCRQGAQLVQPGVEEGVAARFAVRGFVRRFECGEILHGVADGDVRQGAALGGHDLDQGVQGVTPDGGGPGGRFDHRFKLGESFRVTGRDQPDPQARHVGGGP
ncbi:hypothetical protein ABT126_44980 [Streptomyces sp. NPDC002012]|uniref:hypothetical protein n=1 Tax=Streptomyces sp. NPDC002012 TaxID=3154532 RepID=UPI00331E54FA